ncbi:MAG: hypothetical protein ACK5VI_10765 [Opitutia bacterium]|jgi:hypothetical protein
MDPAEAVASDAPMLGLQTSLDGIQRGLYAASHLKQRLQKVAATRNDSLRVSASDLAELLNAWTVLMTVFEAMIPEPKGSDEATTATQIATDPVLKGLSTVGMALGRAMGTIAPASPEGGTAFSDSPA